MPKDKPEWDPYDDDENKREKRMDQEAKIKLLVQGVYKLSDKELHNSLTNKKIDELWSYQDHGKSDDVTESTNSNDLLIKHFETSMRNDKEKMTEKEPFNYNSDESDD